MPSFTDTDGRRIPYASEEEVLDFANRVRTAGGASPLDALLPGTTREPQACLIANALNFESQVNTPLSAKQIRPGEWQWVMAFPAKFTKKRVVEIAKAVLGEEGADSVAKHEMYIERSDTYVERWCIELPRLIGNTASAFDTAKRGWITKYRRAEEE